MTGGQWTYSGDWAWGCRLPAVTCRFVSFCAGLTLTELKIRDVALSLLYYCERHKTNKMAFIDYYKIMGVPKDTPQADLRAAYKKRTKQFHPDLHPEDPKAKAKFQALNEAYNVLSDPEKRRKYDQYGEHWQEAGMYGAGGDANGGGAAWGDGFAGFDFSQFSGGAGGFSSFFEDLFGGGAGRAASRPEEANMNVKVGIDLYTALLGGEVLLQTRTGKLRLKVKPCTQNESKVRLRGKGYRRSDGTYGDMIITYNVKLPDSLTEEQQALLRKMRGG